MSKALTIGAVIAICVALVSLFFGEYITGMITAPLEDVTEKTIEDSKIPDETKQPMLLTWGLVGLVGTIGFFLAIFKIFKPYI
jgi:uncharacterized membrane protein